MNVAAILCIFVPDEASSSSDVLNREDVGERGITSESLLWKQNLNLQSLAWRAGARIT